MPGLNGEGNGRSRRPRPRPGTAPYFGTPVIMLSGDQAAANEIREIVPEVEIAGVKEGIGRYTCISLSAPAAQEAVREAARRSVGKIGRIKPYTVKGPVTLQGVHHAKLTPAGRGVADGSRGLGRPHHSIQGARHPGGLEVVPVEVMALEPCREAVRSRG